MENLKEVLGKTQIADGVSSQTNWIENAKKIAELVNKQPGNLTGYDCKECLNRGWFERVDDNGYKYSEPCKCMKVRKSMKAIQRSGISDLLDTYTFDNWEQKTKWQAGAIRDAVRYAEEKDGWFIATGRPGTGKTHLCTAICGKLLKDCLSVKYVLWRDFSTLAKAAVTDEEEYKNLIEPLKRIKVLYIDDMFKTGKGQSPTAGDINLAFEIINARYNNRKLLTIISSELSLEQILDIDEAIGSRIRERSKKYYLDFSNYENWRLK